MISNLDIFMQLYDLIKQSKSPSDVVKEFGGSNVYVPSYKSTYRNEDILKEYREAIDAGKDPNKTIRELAAKHNLSYNSICNIIKESKKWMMTYLPI